MKLIKELDALVEASTNVAEGHDEDDEKNPFDELEYGKEYPKDKIQSMIDHGYAEVQSGDIDNPRRPIQLLNLDTRETQMIYVKEGAIGVNAVTNVAEGSGTNVVKSVKVGNFRHDLVDHGYGWQVRIYNGDELYHTGLSKNSEQKGLASLDDAVSYTKKQLNIKEGSQKLRYHVVSKLDGWVLASYATREEALKAAGGNPVVSGELETVGDHKFVKEAAYAGDLDPNAPIVVTGVKGMASKPFKKKFKNMDAYDVWCDSEEAGDCEVHKVINEDAAESHRSNIEVIASVDGLMVLCDGKNFSLRSGGKRHAKISHDDWAHLAAAVKNRVTVTVGNMTLEPHADSWELKDSSGKSFASLDASEIDGLMAGVDAHLKKAHVDSDTAHSVKEDTHEDHETGATDSDEIADYDRGEYDREGDMAHTQLHTICAASQDLLEMIDAEDNLPEWVQSKLTLAQDYLTTVRDYLAAKKHDHAAE